MGSTRHSVYPDEMQPGSFQPGSFMVPIPEINVLTQFSLPLSTGLGTTHVSSNGEMTLAHSSLPANASMVLSQANVEEDPPSKLEGWPCMPTNADAWSEQRKETLRNFRPGDETPFDQNLSRWLLATESPPAPESLLPRVSSARSSSPS
jgi:hypothetical protein